VHALLLLLRLITQIDRQNYHLLQPLLYEVANGSLEPEEIAAPLRGVLSRQRNTCGSLGNVVGAIPIRSICFWKTELFLVPRQTLNFGGATRAQLFACAGGLLTDTGGDLVFRHARLQGRPLQAHPGGGAVLPPIRPLASSNACRMRARSVLRNIRSPTDH
jgi:hypothetical protein